MLPLGIRQEETEMSAAQSECEGGVREGENDDADADVCGKGTNEEAGTEAKHAQDQVNKN